MKIMSFAISCSSCQHSFSLPLLSDFSYGEILIPFEDGTRSAYLNLLDNKTVKLIFETAKSKSQTMDIYALQRWLISKVADKFDCGILSSGAKHFCPECRSTNLIFDDSKPMGTTEIDEIQFSMFEAKTDIEQAKELNRLLGEYCK